MRIKVGLGVLMFAGGAMALTAQQPLQSTGTSSSDGRSQMSTTPRAGSSTSSTDTSRSSQPGMETKGNMHAPMMASDCTNDGWRGYTSPKFKSEKACQSYVKKHMKKGMAGDTTGTTGETNAPHPDMSSGTGANTGTHTGTGTTSGSTSSGAQPRPTPRP